MGYIKRKETFYPAVRSVDRFDGSCKLSVWLCQIAKHLWYQHLRKHQRKPVPLETAPESYFPSAEEGLLAQEEQVALLRQIHQLPEPQREVVYLKRVKTRNNRRIIAAVVCTVLVLVAGLLAKLFIIGTPLQPQSMVVMEAVEEVWLGGVSGRLLWQDGVIISPLALELLDARAPYCGDPTALSRIAEILRLPDRLGSYTFSLQTDKHPYGGTLEFADRPTAEQLNLVTCYNLLTLALVDNMEASLFKCPATSAGTRKIVLPASTAQILRDRKKFALTEWIFPNPLRPEQPADPGSAYRRLKTLLKQAGLPSIRFHDLRHTFATLALQHSVDVKTISSMLGHYGTGFTLRTYTHATRQQQNRAAETMVNFMAQVM